MSSKTQDAINLQDRFKHFGLPQNDGLPLVKTIPHSGSQWLELKRGRFSSSKAESLGATRAITKGLRNYAFEKAFEVFSMEHAQFSNYYMNRGLELEPLAIEVFEENSGVSVIRNQLYLLGEHIASSPDGVVDHSEIDKTAGVEVKCLKGGKVLQFINALKSDEKQAKMDILKEHYKQMQFQMFACGFDFVYFVVFCPTDTGYFLEYTKVYPDEKYQTLLWWKLENAIELKKQYIAEGENNFKKIASDDLQEWSERMYQIRSAL